jgi:hypothetical protein
MMQEHAARLSERQTVQRIALGRPLFPEWSATGPPAMLRDDPHIAAADESIPPVDKAPYRAHVLS